MSEQTTDSTFDSNLDSNAYWRLAAIVMGLGFMISMAAHLGGPSTARASYPEDSFHGQLAIAQNSDQTLAVGGFDKVNELPAFVILDAQGRRVGVLPMNTAAASEPLDD